MECSVVRGIKVISDELIVEDIGVNLNFNKVDGNGGKLGNHCVTKCIAIRHWCLEARI